MATQDVTIRFEGDTGHLDRALRRAQRGLRRIETQSKQSTRALQGINAAAGRVNTALTAAGVAFAGFVTSRGIQGILNATQQMEGFRTQLTAYLGSQKLANAELSRLSTLANSLTQDLPEVTNAFVIFQRNGIEASNEALTAFSKVAAGNNKSMVQLGEAVADALTEEFERLKEFGIKVSKENDQFVVRMADGSTQIVNSAKEVVDAVRAQGEEGGRFANVVAGPMTQALSNLKGAVFEAQVALGEQGLALAVADTANKIKDLLTNNKALVREIGVNLTKAFLAVTAVGEFLVKNLDLIGKAFILIIKIKMAFWAASLAKGMFNLGKTLLSLGTTVVAAGKHFVRFGKILINFIPGGAVVRGVLLGLTAIATALGLVSGETEEAAEKAEESGNIISNALDGVAESLGIEGLEELQASFDNLTADAERYADEAQAAAEALSKQEASAAITAQQTERQADAAEAAATAFSNILLDKQEELRVAGLSVDQQRVYNLEKEVEQKLGREINDDEREQLRLLVEQTRQQEKIAKFANIAKGIANDMASITLVEQNDRLAELEAGYRRVTLNLIRFYEEADQSIYNSRAELDRELVLLAQQAENERYQITKQFAEKRLKVQEDAIRRELELYDGAIAQRLTGEQQATLQAIGNNERQQRIVNERIEFEKKSEAEKWQWAVGQAGDAFEQLGRYNKEAFEASKALRIAEAIMATYQAATLALATYPPPFGFIGAAVAVAAGLANVAAIRSQTYSGRALGGPVMGNETYMVGENGPELFTPATSGRITRNDQIGDGRPVEINFTINAVDTQSFDELLLQRRGVIQQVISDAMLESGTRSRF